jgi:hypothetical protein
MPSQSPIDDSSRTAGLSRQSVALGRGTVIREAVSFCCQRRSLRRTIGIALVVGVVLTLINQGTVIADGHATTATWLRCLLNFVVPFLVSNAGLLSGRRPA